MMVSDNDQNGYGLTGLDYWRLSDELSVIDAVFLTLNLNPGCFEISNPTDPANSKIIRIAGFEDFERNALHNGDIEEVELEPNHFRAVFKGLRSAVLENDIRARIVARARRATWEDTEFGPYNTGRNSDESEVYYEYVIGLGARFFTNVEELTGFKAKYGEPRRYDDAIYFLKEPDWTETMFSVDDLKELYAKRGLQAAFFFPSSVQEGYRDKNHARYTPKLAAAVAAWESVKKAGKNKSVKQTLVDWIVSNGVQFGLGNNENVVSPTAAEEVAKISNWQTGGGATKTALEDDGDVEDRETPIQNFSEIVDDSEIPF